MTLKHIILLVLLVHVRIFCIAQITEDAATYIRSNAVPLDTTYNNLDSFAFLKDVLKGNRIVGMGEATHGTHEFQTMKTNVFKYLVQHMGYKLIGIEANFTECRDLNNYILSGVGNPVKAINAMVYVPWRTKEVLTLVNWMADYNKGKSEKDKIRFYGFDMQIDSKANEEVIKKLKHIDSIYFNEHFTLLQSTRLIDISKGGIYEKLSAGKVDSLKTLYTKITNYVISKEKDFIKLYSKDEYAYTLRDIRLLEQCLDEDEAFNSKYSRFRQMQVRDKYMAENISWTLDHEGPESKMLVWAHNAHISKIRGSIDYMGGHLKNLYKSEYYAIGFDFNAGSFRAGKVFTVGNAIKGSTGNIFSSFERPALFIDIAKAVDTKSPAKSFFMKKIPQRMVGGLGFDPAKENDYYVNDPLYTEYDGLIFINTTSATRLLN